MYLVADREPDLPGHRADRLVVAEVAAVVLLAAYLVVRRAPSPARADWTVPQR